MLQRLWGDRRTRCGLRLPSVKRRSRMTRSCSFVEALEQRLLLASPDAFEPDDTPETASVIAANGAAQTHTIHGGGTDVDWMRFNCFRCNRGHHGGVRAAF